MFTNQLTNSSTAVLDELQIRTSPGVYQDILSLIGSGGGGYDDTALQAQADANTAALTGKLSTTVYNADQATLQSQLDVKQDLLQSAPPVGGSITLLAAPNGQLSNKVKTISGGTGITLVDHLTPNTGGTGLTERSRHRWSTPSGESAHSCPGTIAPSAQWPSET